MTFTIDGAPRPATTLAVIHGQDEAALTLPLAAGTHQVYAVYGGDNSFTGSTSNGITVTISDPSTTPPSPAPGTPPPHTTPPPKAVDGPRVMSLVRHGFHAQPTTLVIGFDEALDRIAAENPLSYQITGPGGRDVRIQSAVYDPSDSTVTIRPATHLNLHYTYKLIIKGRGPRVVADGAGDSPRRDKWRFTGVGFRCGS